MNSASASFPSTCRSIENGFSQFIHSNSVIDSPRFLAESVQFWKQMELRNMLGRLFPRSDNAPFLHPQEVARRITDHFPGAIIDWNSPNQRLQSELENLRCLGAPAPIIEGHLNLFGNTADITVNSTLNPENGMHLMVYLDSAVELFSTGDISTHAALAEFRGLVLQIAECLDYDVEMS